MKAILFVDYRQLINYFRITLRSPKRLIPALVFLLYILHLFVIQLLGRVPMQGMSGRVVFFEVERVWPIAFIFLSLGLVYFLVKSFSDSLLVFPLAEIDFLFGTPINRRLVVLIKLLKLYAKFSLFALFYVLLLMPSMGMMSMGISSGLIVVAFLSIVMYAASIINLCTVVNLITTFRHEGRWWLSWVIKGVIYGLLVFGAAGVALSYRQTGDILSSLHATLTNPVFIVLLAPAKWTTDIMLSTLYGWRSVLTAELLMLIAASSASLVLVLTRKENPYEPSLSVSSKAASIKAAFRAGGFGWLKGELAKDKRKSTAVAAGLPPFGAGAWAVVWKNANVTYRTWRKTIFAAAFLMLAGMIGYRVFVSSRLDPDDVTMVGLMVAFYMLWITSMMMQHAFRGDVRQANTLKPMPIESWKLIAAVAVQGPLTMTVIAWSITSMLLLLFGLPVSHPVILIALVLPFAAYAAACSQAVVAVLYPNWQDQAQQFLGFALSGLASTIAITPPMVVGLVLYFMRLHQAVIFAAVAAVCLSMASLGIIAGATAYNRFDPTGE